MGMINFTLGPLSVDLCEVAKFGKQVIYGAVNKIKNIYDNKKKQTFIIAIIDDFCGTKRTDPFIMAWGKVRASKEDIESIPQQTIYPILNLQDLFLPEDIIESHEDLNGFEPDTPELTEFDYIIK